nr:hypothetical protein [Paenibacillus bovis]
MSVLLSACNSSEKGGTRDTEKEVSSGVEENRDNVDEDKMKKNPEPDDEKLTEYEGCNSVLLSTSQEISGSDLANCVLEAMIMQQTGTHIVKNNSGITTTVDFTWNPFFAMSVDNGQFGAVLTEDTGWMQTHDGRWIEENHNSTHPETIIANTVIKGYRTFVDPQFIAELLGQVSMWSVVGEDDIPDSDAFTNKAWKLTSEDVIDMEISIISELEFWITNDYLAAYFVATGTIGDLSDRSSNTFTQWGGKVEIPTPEEDILE